MKAKDLFIDFLNVVFLVILIGFVIFFFIVGNRFGVFIEILKSFVPIAIFSLIFLVVMNIKRLALRKKRADGEEDKKIILYLSPLALLVWDAIIFSLPVVILTIALFIDKEVTITDIMQATIALLLMYYWKKTLLNKGDIY